MQRTATHATTHCNTLQHTATHCNTLQVPFDWEERGAPIVYNCTDKDVADTLQRPATHAAIRCNILQHTATLYRCHSTGKSGVRRSCTTAPTRTLLSLSWPRAQVEWGIEWGLDPVFVCVCVRERERERAQLECGIPGIPALWYDRFHWKCYTPETHQIQKHEFLGTNSN